MRTRQKSLVDFGVYPEDVNRLKDICQKATQEQRHDILHCCISSCPPGIELLVYESIVTNVNAIPNVNAIKLSIILFYFLSYHLQLKL